MKTHNKTNSLKGRKNAGRERRRAFTFVEVVIALAIVSISLLTLLRLHLISIRMVDKAQITTQAVLLANEKIAEVMAAGFPQEGTDSGTTEQNGLTLSWQTEVRDVQPGQLEKEQISGLRKILVDITWKQGRSRKQLQTLTYVADRKLP